MAERLKNTLQFTNLAPGASVVLPHGLQTSRPRPLAPDIIYIPDPSLDVTSNTIDVTLTNTGLVPLSGSVLVESWHTIERAFGDVEMENLPIKPYIVVMAEAGNSAPWPAFPAGAPIVRVIYARTTGSDTTGTGTLANPYRSFARAILDVPRVIDPGYRCIIDITDIGVETLPQDWAAPPIRTTLDTAMFSADDPPWAIIASPLTIRATPKLGLPGTDAIVTAADAATVAAVGPGLCKVTLGVARPAWAAGSLKGKQVLKTLSGGGVPCCIFDNTTTELFLCNTAAAFNGGIGALVLAPGEELRIVEPSATLQAPPSGRGDAMVFSAIDQLNFSGIKFTCTVPLVGNGALLLAGALQAPFFELCVIEELDFFANGYQQVGLFSTTLRGYLQCSSADLTPRRSYWDAVGSTFTINLFQGAHQFRQCVLENCLPIGPTNNTIPGAEFPASGIGMLQCWLKTSQGNALEIKSPTHLYLEETQIDGATGNAVSMDGPGKAVLVNVTGSGNAGYGVVTDDGAHVQVDAAVTVGNADGRAYTNGAAAPVAAWPGAPFNAADATTFSRIWEP